MTRARSLSSLMVALAVVAASCGVAATPPPPDEQVLAASPAFTPPTTEPPAGATTTTVPPPSVEIRPPRQVRELEPEQAPASTEPPSETSTTTTEPATATTTPPPPTTTTSTTTATTIGPGTAPDVLTREHQAAMALQSGDIEPELGTMVFSTAEVYATYSWYFEVAEWETYVEAYVNPADFISDDRVGTISLDTGSIIMSDDGAAAERITSGFAAARTDDYLDSFAEFEVSGVGDEAVGLIMQYAGDGVWESQVAFRRDRVLAMVTVTTDALPDVSAEVIALARKMDDRIKGVLSGGIPPKAIPNLDGNAWFAPTERLQSFRFNSALSVEGPGVDVNVTTEGRFTNPANMECETNTVAGTHLAIAIEDHWYIDSGSGFVNVGVGDPVSDQFASWCPGHVAMWEDLGFTEADIQWFAGSTAAMRASKNGRDTRFYDLSGTLEAVDVLGMREGTIVTTLKVWYDADDLWPVAVELAVTGDAQAVLGGTFGGSGQVTATLVGNITSPNTPVGLIEPPPNAPPAGPTA